MYTIHTHGRTHSYQCVFPPTPISNHPLICTHGILSPLLCWPHGEAVQSCPYLTHLCRQHFYPSPFSGGGLSGRLLHTLCPPARHTPESRVCRWEAVQQALSQAHLFHTCPPHPTCHRPRTLPLCTAEWKPHLSVSHTHPCVAAAQAIQQCHCHKQRPGCCHTSSFCELLIKLPSSLDSHSQ